MTKRNLVLGLFADRIDVLSCEGGHVADSRRVAAAFGTDPQQWRKALHDAAKPLHAAVKELAAEGAAATVLYRDPTACADYASLPIRSTAEAEEAAILGCADALSCSMDDAASAAITVAQDHGGAEAQTHVVVAADHDETLDAIASLVEKAGLKFSGATPIDSILMTRLAQSATASRASQSGYLYVGESRSFLIIADSGRLLFARPISLGTDALCTSLTRSIRAGGNESPIELTFDAAREILNTHGFPAREQIVHPGMGLTGAHVIPLLQPILQRFIVELRQSLRFGVAEEKRQSLALTLLGPGSAIKNFSSLLATELHLTVQPDERYAAYDCRAADSCGSELMDAIEDRRILQRLALRPYRLAAAHHMGRLRRCLWTGAAAAMVIIAVDTFVYQQRLTNARQEADAAQSHRTDFKALQTTGERLFAAIAAIDKLESSITREIGTTFNVRAGLQEFTRITPEPLGSVQLTAIIFNRDKGATTGRINGYALNDSSNAAGAAGRSQLEPFIARLKASPLFDDVILTNVHAISLNSAAAQQFEINFTGVEVPSRSNAATVAAASFSSPGSSFAASPTAAAEQTADASGGSTP